MKGYRRVLSLGLCLAIVLAVMPLSAAALDNKATGQTRDITVGIIRDGEAVDNASGRGGRRFAKASASIKTESSAIETDEDGKPIVPDDEEGYVYYVQDYWTIDNKNNGYSVSNLLVYWKITKPGEDGNTTEVDNIIEYLNDNGGYYGTPYAGTWNIVLGEANSSDLIGGLYCVDWSTSTTDNVGYRIVSLEDAAAEGYYTEDQVAHLRAIIKYGYDWSVDSEEETPGTESLGSFKELMTEALEKDPDIGFTADDINKLSRSDAAAITQIALWTYANRIQVGDDQTLEISVATGSSGSINEAYTAMARYLASLTDDGSDDSQTVPYSEDNFVNDVDIIIGSMVRGNPNNMDNDPDNDVYDVGLKFSMKVTPGENDDLVIQVIDNEGNILKTARIAGENSDGEAYEYAKTETSDDGTTCYVLEGLTLAENSDTTFSLKLTGTQYLEEGIYVFRARNDDEGASGSQNLIGKFQGYSQVDVSSDISLNFNVEEGTITTWENHSPSPISDMGGGSKGNSNTTDSDSADGDTLDEELPDGDTLDEELPDGDTPADDTSGSSSDVAHVPQSGGSDIADPSGKDSTDPNDDLTGRNNGSGDSDESNGVPKTGDNSDCWIALTALCGLGLAALALTGKRKRA